MSGKIKEHIWSLNETQLINLDSIADCNTLYTENISNDLTDDYPITCIDAVQIKNFRWFSQINNEDLWCRFNFAWKTKAILYAPNWWWKSSFCEWLEWILTGDIKECKRRNKELGIYIQNKKNLWTPTVLINDSIVNFNLSQKEKYKRCFIEKNRVTEFSLFRSKDTEINTPQDALTILLWFNELDNFISSFVRPDSFNFDIIEIAKKDYEAFENELKIKKSNYDFKTKELIDLKSQIITKWLWSIDWEQITINADLITKIEKEKKQKEEELKMPDIIAQLIVHSYDDLNLLIKNIAEKEAELISITASLTQKKEKVDFKILYETIVKLPKEDICPACQTPSTAWITNPYDNAQTEIDKMGDIISLEENFKLKTLELQESQLKKNEFISNIEKNKKLLSLIFGEENVKNIDDAKYFDMLSTITSSSINTTDLQENIQVLKDKIFELNRLIKDYEEAKKIVDAGFDINLESQLAEKRILKEKEEARNIELWQFKSSYRIFRSKIDDFYTWYISRETEWIRENVCEYYKRINSHDEESEKVDSIQCTSSNTAFSINLMLVDGTPMDAINELSEWHLRTLWLAVLFANMKKHNVPFMIFDDVVNAIDTEHRANIIDLIYSDPFLSSKQIILTTHDRLFWERFCNIVNVTEYISYIFVNYEWGKSIKEYNNLNYSEKVTHSLEYHDIRQAILYIRIWFERLILSYCKKKELEVKWTIKKNTTGLVLETTIELLYGKFYQNIKLEQNWSQLEESAYLALKDQINWRIINWEWHAHDNNTYNINHSATSLEVAQLQSYIIQLDNFIQPIIHQ